MSNEADTFSQPYEADTQANAQFRRDLVRTVTRRALERAAA